MAERERVEKYDFTDDEIGEIVRIINEEDGIDINIPETVFNVEFLHTNIRFNRDESIYKINVNKDAMQSLPDFLSNIKKVFQYFINVARIMSSSGKDKVRFYISKAPRTPFSSAILNVEDLNVFLQCF